MIDAVTQAGAELWIVGLLVFVLGGMAGAALVVVLGRTGLMQGRARQELAQTKQAFDRYRGSVDTHFHKTAELFDALNDRCQGLYQHMAEGAESLCESGADDRSLEFSTQALGVTAESDEPAPVIEPSVPPEVVSPDELYRKSEGLT